MKKKITLLFLWVTLVMNVFSQTFNVSGTVLSAEDNQPIIGANIWIKGVNKGTVSDINGRFSIEVEKNQTLVISYLGFENVEQRITGPVSNLKIILQPSTVVLEEVVAVGYGTMKKRDLTGAIASVTGEDLRKLPAATVDKALQGLSPGVTAIANSGQPGADMVIRIRGIGTINDSSPIFVVDGVQVGNINFLSPADIKSVEILKDASACAIYGARGANGVILITTRQGDKSGKMKLNVEAYYGIQNKAKKLDLMNSEQLSRFLGYTGDTSEEFNQWIYDNFAGSKTYIPKGIDFSSYDTDWQEVVFDDNAPIQNYYVAAEGGSEKTNYFLSAGYFDQKGIIMASFYNRFTFRINSSTKINDWLTLGENLSLMNSHNRNAPNNNDNYSMLNSALRFAPWDPVRFPNGNVSASTIANYPNPLSMVEFIHPKNNWDRLVGDAYLQIKPIKELVYKADFGFDLSYGQHREFKDKYEVAPFDKMDNNFVTSSFERYQTWSIEQTLTYSKILEKHNFSLMIGQSLSEYSYYSLGGSRTDIANPRKENWYISMGTGEYTVSDGVGRSRLASFLGRLNYSYADRYLLTVNFRADGSSKFPKDKLWGYFPSFSLGWRVSEENFFIPLRSVFDSFKLRVGWGQIGNENIPSNNYFAKVQTGSQFVTYVLGDDQHMAYGATMTSLPSEYLKWETTEQTNVGIDVSFLNTRLNGSIDYYIRDTKDMFLNVVLPKHIGMLFSSPANVGKVRNKGFEFLVNWKDKVSKDFNYSISANLSTVNNKFVDMSMSSPLYYEGFKGENLVVCKEGYPLYSFYGYTYDGIFQNQQEVDEYVKRDENGDPLLDANGDLQYIISGVQPGDVRYVDKNNDGQITDLDKSIIGSSFPTFTYGFNIFVGYKGFDCSLFFQGVSGNKIYNCNKFFMQGGEGIKLTNLGTEMLHSFTTDQPSTTIPRAKGRASNYWASDRFLEDGSYLRLKNAQIGYSLPPKVLSNAKIESCRLYISGANLLTFTNYTGYDPEASFRGVDRGNYPQAVTFLFGVQLGL
ncbi:MAG TPA: TonB-dependent receptor [Paludibacteraceae bacterium]|nr:TonB-dependent receptor [Paludibacteraceae bacterium]